MSRLAALAYTDRNLPASCAAAVDYEQWIAARLQRAAAARSSRDKQHAEAAGVGKQQEQPRVQQQELRSFQQQQQLQRTPVRRASVSLRTPSGKLPAARLTTSSAPTSRRSSAADNHPQPAQQVAWQVGLQPETTTIKLLLVPNWVNLSLPS